MRHRGRPITTLFLDIGGVLLTDGWDRRARARAATKFGLELAELEPRHHLVFEAYEVGKLTLDEYLSLVVAVVSNEGRELNAHRVRTFELDRLADCFVSSSFVHVRKPDADIFRIALDLVQTPASQVAYVEDTPMFAQIAEVLGIRSVLHTDYRSTRAKLASFGLRESRS